MRMSQQQQPNRIVTSFSRVVGAAIVLVVAAAVGGCGKSATSKRPLLASSATEAATLGTADEGSSELDFFDALATRNLVCHDDVLHGALLLGNGESAATYPDRVALAKQLGYVDLSFSRPALEASTLGEVAKVMLRVSEGSAMAGRYNQEQAMLRLAGRGLMPVQAQPYQGMTGAQFVTVLAGVRESMDDRPRPRIRLVNAESIPPAVPASEPPAATLSDSSAIASADGGAGAAGEPIPASALDRSIEKPVMAPVVDVVEPAAAFGESATEPLPAATPAATSSAPPSKPRVWVSGTPLRKP
jgi:hypothetical protein